MYAKDAEELETAIVDFKETVSNDKYLKRVEEALEHKEEWVLVFREWLLTRGHNTNNFSEAHVRVMKDIILGRIKALNPVALTDFAVNVMDPYFKRKLLRFAYNRMSGPHLQYEKLLRKMDPKFADEIVKVDSVTYIVPSGTDTTASYEVLTDIGHCTCYAGRQGAFCKHQGLVHSKFGGLFPNAPPVTSRDRYTLGKLAMGDKCPPADFFKGLQEDFDGDQSDFPTLTSSASGQVSTTTLSFSPLKLKI